MLNICTRKSPLALWQAERAALRPREAQRGLQVALVPLTTQGEMLRGSVGTRLNKLDNGDLEAIQLAAAEMVRLGCETASVPSRTWRVLAGGPSRCHRHRMPQ